MSKPPDVERLSNSDKFETARRVLRVVQHLTPVQQREVLVILGYETAGEMRKALAIVEHMAPQDRADVCRCLSALIGEAP